MNNLRKLLPAALMLTVSFGIQTNANAGVLDPDPSQNINLADGDYVFAGAHPVGASFLDELQFSLATGDHVTATVENSFIQPPGGTEPGIKLMDNKFLTISLFDGNGNFITAAGAGGTLSAGGLSDGVTYTLAISGKASGIFGGVYDGKLTADAPLPAALPAFTSALLALGWRRKKADTV
jgi:hypothetical protein